jgi:hypothetical protein
MPEPRTKNDDLYDGLLNLYSAAQELANRAILGPTVTEKDHELHAWAREIMVNSVKNATGR